MRKNKESIISGLENVFETEKLFHRSDLDSKLLKLNQSYKTAVQEFLEKDNPTALLTFGKDTFPNFYRYELQRQVAHQVFSYMFENAEVIVRDRSVAVEVGLVSIWIETFNFSKTLYVSSNGISNPKSNYHDESMLFDSKGNPKKLLLTVKACAEKPSLKNKLAFVKVNTAARKGFLSKYFGYIKSFKKIDDEDFVKDVLRKEEDYLKRKPIFQKEMAKYEQEQNEIEEFLKEYQDFFQDLEKMGWYICYRKIESKKIIIE